MNTTVRDVKADAARLIETVAKGGVAVFPVDVGYAIVGNTEPAIARVFACKKRSFEKACGMFSNRDMLVNLSLLDERAIAIVDSITRCPASAAAMQREPQCPPQRRGGAPQAPRHPRRACPTCWETWPCKEHQIHHAQMPWAVHRPVKCPARKVATTSAHSPGGLRR